MLFIMKSMPAEIASNSLVIEWTNFVGDKWSYRLREIAEGAIRVELNTNGQVLVVQTNQFQGGMGELSKVAQSAVSEISTNHPNIAVGKTKCKLVLKTTKGTMEGQASIEGDLKPLLNYFYSNSHMRELLGFVSANLPKKYRLVDETGPFLKREGGKRV